MLVLLSPAKRLDFEPSTHTLDLTRPALIDRTADLSKATAKLSKRKIKTMMELSDDLAELNYQRFQAFDPDAKDGKAAALAFAGEVYRGLNAEGLSDTDLKWAQDHLRILSGMYGVLRPLDAIQPYRLEMGSRLKTRRGGSLYDYWRDVPAKALNAAAEAVGTDVLVNCASQEYFGAVDLKALKLRVVTPVFLEDKGGKASVVSFFAKRARGAMARFVVQHRLNDPEALAGFDAGGYAYDPERSEPDRPVFVRPYSA